MSVRDFVTTGHMEDGKLHLRNRRKYDAFCQALQDGECVVRITPVRAKRSQRQNAFYHAVLVEMIAEETGHSSVEIHEFLKRECNAKVITICDRESGEVLREETVGMSTATLNVNDFSDYLERCRAWAGQFLGLVVPDPDPAYRWKRKQQQETT